MRVCERVCVRFFKHTEFAVLQGTLSLLAFAGSSVQRVVIGCCNHQLLLFNSYTGRNKEAVLGRQTTYQCEVTMFTTCFTLSTLVDCVCVHVYVLAPCDLCVYT